MARDKMRDNCPELASERGHLATVGTVRAALPLKANATACLNERQMVEQKEETGQPR